MYKRYIMAIFLIGMGTNIFAQDISATDPVAGPRMVFKETAFDFGEVEEGEIATHIFKFRNIGTDTLYIKKVSGG